MVVSRIQRARARIRHRANVAIRASAGLSKRPPPRCDDTDLAYSDVDGVARIVHGDLPAMLIGGLGSLFFQMLHPYAMAGVADHSRYQEDPLGRLLQTANFISATTFGSRSQAQSAIDRVLNVHTFVHGVADDGVAYDANDPHLLLWVHCAEISMFLSSYQLFGATKLSSCDADRYVSEMIPLALDLGVLDPPHNVVELRAALANFRSELRLSKEGEVARDFVAHGVMKSRAQRSVYRLLVLSSWSLLEPSAQELLGVHTNPTLNRIVVRPTAKIVSRLIRLAVPPVPLYSASDNPPSTTTT